MATAAKKPKFDAYNWEGVDKAGKKVRGEMEAASIAFVNATLRRQGINPVKVSRRRAAAFSFKKKIVTKDIAIFTRQLATMLQAGIPVAQAFDIVGKGSENPSMQELIMSVKQDVETGTNLTQALSKHPLYFDALYCNLVAAGEQAGILDGILEKLAIYKEKIEAIKGKIKAALFYPTAIIVVAFIITAVLLVFVIPQFEDLFKGFGADLPALTRMVINLSRTFQDWWHVIFGSIIGAVVFLGYSYKRSTKMQHTMDRLLLRAPIVGIIVKKATIARFSRTLATMSAAGVPLVEAMIFDVPVLAYAAAAVPYTLGDAGLLVHEKNFARTAETLHRLFVEDSFKAEVLTAQRRRVETLAPERVEAMLQLYVEQALDR